jgi:hypothetical protein
MSHSEDRPGSQRELAALQEDFPGFRIWREVTGERVRLVAVRRRHGTSPHTVVTAEAAELRAVLSGHRHAAASPGPARQP